MFKKIFLLLMFSFYSTTCFAQLENKSQAQIIEEILELSGATEQIKQIPAMVSAQLEQKRNEISPEAFDKTKEIMTSSFEDTKLLQYVSAELEKNYNQEDFLLILKLLQSPFLKKMAQLEIEASKPESTEKIKDFANEISMKPPEAQRIALMLEMDNALGATNLAIQINIAAFKSLALSINPALPPEKQLKEGELEKLTAQIRAQLQNQLANNTLLSFLYTYRDVSNKEMQDYINFWKSKPGALLNKLLSNAFSVAMSEGTKEAGRRILEVLPKEKKEN